MISVNIYVPVKHFPYLVPANTKNSTREHKLVDIWVGDIAPGRQTEYFKEDYIENEDNTPVSEFAFDQGQTWIDHDFLEIGYNTAANSIDELLKGSSWSDQYREELINLVNEKDVELFNSIVLLNAGEVKYPRSVQKQGIDLHYMGQFIIKT